MGVESVHRVLLDLFPQVDHRALRAVAFAHSKDADAAVEAVLVEVIPSLTQELTKSSSSNVSGSLSAAVDAADQLNPESVKVDESLLYFEKGAHSRHRISDVSYDSFGESEDEEPSSLWTKSQVRSDEVSPSLQADAPENRDEADTVHLQAHQEYLNKSMSDVDGANHQELLHENGSASKMISQEWMGIFQESSVQLVPRPDAQVTNLGTPDTNIIDAASNEELSSGEKDDLKDNSAMNTAVPQPINVCSIDVLEDLIEEARNNKKTLVSAMDAIVSFAREVEIQEKAALTAKEQASCGYLDIHRKVNELKAALQRAKEANDMHAGEVHAEKAVLTTEAKELQSRLLGLSEERDCSLRILDEMRQALVIRLSAAEKLIEEAEREKQEKEGSALEALALQERIMEEVVQESRLLKEEAEENSKLQDFLMDRGRIVDVLQGEISVKCQDVRLLKEKFDAHVPLSTSFFSSQTMSSSSYSSSRSLSPPRHVPELAGTYDRLEKTAEFVDTYETLEKNSEVDSDRTSEDGSLELLKTKTNSGNEEISAGEKKTKDYHKMLKDDEWEWDILNGKEYDESK